MDVAQNSISAGAQLITVTVKEEKEELVITIADNGKGMTPEQVQSVTDPFYTTRTTRKVGLGVPLFKMEAEMTGGDLTVVSEVGKGTTVTARFITSHVDMIPLGEINETVLMLITCNPDRDFVFQRVKDGRSFTLDTREMREILGGVALNTPQVVEWMRDFLTENTELILKGGIQDEILSGTSGN